MVKLGFSRDPVPRLNFQLRGRRDLDCTLVRTVPMVSGHRALCTERRMHAELRRSHPQAVVPPAAYRGLIKVRSEVYDAALELVIAAMLDMI